MRVRSGMLAAVAIAASFVLAPAVRADDSDLAKKVDALSKQVQELKEAAPAAAAAEPAKRQWITFGGDLRVRHDMLRAKIPSYTQFMGFSGGNPQFAALPAATVRNDSLLTNRLGLNALVTPAEGVSMHIRLIMYKIFGMADGSATQAGFFADRQNQNFDGTVGHVPGSDGIFVDYAYATVKDLFGSSAWFSAGRRPSTGGVPTNIREDREVNGAAGIPGLLVDYAFDGGTIGIAPEIAKLPGFAAKLCYGRGFESGYSQIPNVTGAANSRDTDFLGASVMALETPDSRVDLQYDRGFNMMDNIPGPNVKTNLGDIQAWGFSGIQTLRDLGPGDLTGFLSAAVSESSPNKNRFNAGFGANNPGLMCDGPDCQNKTGSSYYLGARYDIHKTKTKVGAEFNHGSQNWITFVPAGDDIWTSKLGTRGEVYELYAIQDIGRAPIARDGRVFFRLGWQYYDYKYTGSNSWIGGSHSIKDLTSAQAQFMAPVKSAYDVYTTFEVRF
jgi:hypothetical protein